MTHTIRPEPYDAGPAPSNPADLPRYTEHELHRIADYLRTSSEFFVGMFAQGFEDVVYSPTTDVQRLIFDASEIIAQQPAGVYNTTTGDFTAPEAGIYSILVTVDVGDPGENGQQAHEGIVRIFAPPGAENDFSQGAPDNTGLQIIAQNYARLEKGETCGVLATLIHSQRTVVSTVRVTQRVELVA